MLTIERPALEQLSALLLERAGLRIAPDGFHGLRLALKERMPALGISDAEEYVRRLRERQGEHELRALLPLVTVTHTEFFRDPRQFRALEQRVLPEALARARRDGRKISIWSAGCATGEEPYSLAMLLGDMGAARTEVDLWATDLNQSAVESAQQGRYSLRRMGQVGQERTRRYFDPTEDGYQMKPQYRDWVRFEGHNLAAPVFAKVQPSSFDVILCRNVIIYFDLPTIRALMDRFYAALRPGAFLILGYSESLFRVYDRFEMVEVEGAFLYRRPRSEGAHRHSTEPARLQRPATPQPVSSRPAPRVTGEFPVVVPAKEGRAQRPSPPPTVSGEFAVVVPARLPEVEAQPPSPQSPRPSRRAPAERLLDAAQLVQHGHFDKAVAALRALNDDEPDDISAQLTLANVLSVMGKADEAQKLCQQVLLREPLCVEARVYGAMASMQVRQYATARAELQKAIFLEPTLALAHYLLAQVAEYLGDHDDARRSYRNAIEQLRRTQRPLAGYYPDLPDSPELISRAARYALAALEESPAR